jgi:hypothetical protein
MRTKMEAEEKARDELRTNNKRSSSIDFSSFFPAKHFFLHTVHTKTSVYSLPEQRNSNLQRENGDLLEKQRMASLTQQNLSQQNEQLVRDNSNLRTLLEARQQEINSYTSKYISSVSACYYSFFSYNCVCVKNR